MQAVRRLARPIRRLFATWVYENGGKSTVMRPPVKVGMGVVFVLGSVPIYYCLTKDDTEEISFVSQTLFNVQVNDGVQKILGRPHLIIKREGSVEGKASQIFGGGEACLKMIVDGENGSALVEAAGIREGLYWATKFLRVTPISLDADPILIVDLAAS